MPRKTGGRDATPRPAINTFDPASLPADSLRAIPVVVAAAWPPSARRTRWTTVVTCPYCGGHHRHDAATLDGLRGLRRAGCGRGRYQLALTPVIRQAVRRAA